MKLFVAIISLAIISSCARIEVETFHKLKPGTGIYKVKGLVRNFDQACKKYSERIYGCYIIGESAAQFITFSSKGFVTCVGSGSILRNNQCNP